MMMDNQNELNELVREVMDQMHKRKYGKKISGHYRAYEEKSVNIDLL